MARESNDIILRNKYDKNNWPSELVPYIGKDFLEHSQKNGKPYNTTRNVLVLDLGLDKKFKNVKAQALNDNRSFSLKNFIDALDGEVKIEDIVYHCFLTKTEFDNPLDRFNIDIVCKSRLVDCNCKRIKVIKEFNEKNNFGVSADDLKTSAEVLYRVVKWSRPDIVLILGKPLDKLIDYSFECKFNKKFSNYCEESNSRICVVNWPKGESEMSLQDTFSCVKDFLIKEKKHRYISYFDEITEKIQSRIELVKNYLPDDNSDVCITGHELAEHVLSLSKYQRPLKEIPLSELKNLDAYNMFDGKYQVSLKHLSSSVRKDLNTHYVVKRKKFLSYVLNQMLKDVSSLNALKAKLSDKDKNYYKPQSADDSVVDNRVRAGKRKRRE